jgi:hypothetical protein
MSSFVRLSALMAAAALGGTVMAAAPAAQASAAVRPGSLIPCRTDALVAAINWANGHGGGAFTLSGLCDYASTTPAAAGDGLPVITSAISLTGSDYTVISRSQATATAFASWTSPRAGASA